VLTDNGATIQDERTQGGAVDGEAEDYMLPSGTLVVVKNSIGGDNSFSFSSLTLVPQTFDLTTAGGTAQRAFANLLPGTYDVSETVPAGWNLTSATCSDGSNPASINLAAGENVTCTFQNTKQDSIIVIKRAVGGDDTFPFVSQSLGNFSLTTVNGEVQRTFDNLTPGNYDLSETAPAGWTLTSASCSDGSSPANIQLSPGETVACVFINLKQDTLIIEKRTQGGDGAFAFTSPQLGAFNLTTTGGVASRSFPGLAAGTYNVSETVPAGWAQTRATCDNGDPPGNVRLAPGQTVKCTFENTKQDTIIVVKRAVGGDGTFPFVSQTLGNFSLTTVNGEMQRSFTNLAPGVYDLSETVPAGWTLSGTPTCSDGSPVNRIDLRAGETVVCVFVNLKQDTLVVEKQTTSGDGAFAFTSPQLGAFNLITRNGVASRSFPGLAAGTYTISETVPAGWLQTSAACDNGNRPDNISLAPGATVKCTFNNSPQGSAVATTTTLTSSPNPSLFGQLVTLTATVSAVSGLPTGTVTFSEGALILGTGTLSGGIATLTISTLALGPHPLTATYNGDASFITSVSSIVVHRVVDTAPANIPTLSEWALLLLGLLLGYFVWQQQPRRFE
jgi:plastocyanin